MVEKSCDRCGQLKSADCFEAEGNYVRKTCRVCRKIERRARDRLATYGITDVDYRRLLRKQNYKCAICFFELDRSDNPRAVHIDHCHETAKIRGVLCARCNRALGLFRDSTEVLKNAIRYINCSNS